MISKSPAERYLKYLLSHPDNYDNQSVIRMMVTIRLPYLSNLYLDRLRARCRPPEPFYPRDKKHAPSKEFLKREGIGGLYYRDSFTNQAIEILESPALREVVESMSITKASPSLITEVLKKAHGYECSPNSVAKYEFYFWDVLTMDRFSLRAMLDNEIALVEMSDDPLVRAQYKALKAASYEDPRRTAADIPSSALAARLVQLRLGIRPKMADSAETLQMIQNHCLLQVERFAHANGPRDHDKAVGYMIVAEKAAALLLATSKPEAALREQLRTLILKQEAAPLPMVGDLSGGNHTVDHENLRGPEKKN